MKKLISLIVLFSFNVFAVDTTIQSDTIKFGRPSITGNKTLEFNVNLGSNNPKLRFNSVTGKFQIVGGELEVLNNALTVGDGANTNKVLKFNKGASSPEIRYNSANAKLEFSNDAVTYRAIGSGGGSGDSGVNLLANGSFEDGIATEWSNTGGTFTLQNHTNSTEGNLRFARFVASASGQFFETSLKAIPDFLGTNCQANIVTSTTASAFTAQVLNSSGGILAEAPLSPFSAFRDSVAITFPCPAPAQTIRLRIISTAAGTIDSDLAYLGSNKITTSIGIISDWQTFPMTIGGSVTAPTKGTVTIDRAQWRRVGGDMEIRYDFRQTSAGGAGSGVYLFPIPSGFTIDTTRLLSRTNAEITIVGSMKLSSTTDSQGVTTAPGVVLVSNTFPNNLYLNYASSAPETTAIVGSAAYPMTTTNFSISFFAKIPITGWNAEGAFRADTIGWKVDASISGANPSLGTASVSSYTGIENGSLTLTNNPGAGNIAAQIPCSATNAPTGTTCAVGNESLGVSFVLPRSGDVLACASFGSNAAVTSGTINQIFQIVETANNAQTILQEGKSKPSITIPTSGFDIPWRVCGNFSFSSAGQKTLRLMYEQLVTGTVTQSLVLADAAVVSGQRDIHWEVYPINQGVPAPLIVNSVVTPSAGIEKVVRAKILCAATGQGVVNSSGTWISSVGVRTSGRCDVVLPAGTFSQEPTCVSNNNDFTGPNNVFTNIGTTSTTGFRLNCISTGSACAFDFTANVICMGAN